MIGINYYPFFSFMYHLFVMVTQWNDHLTDFKPTPSKNNHVLLPQTSAYFRIVIYHSSPEYESDCASQWLSHCALSKIIFSCTTYESTKIWRFLFLWINNSMLELCPKSLVVFFCQNFKIIDFQLSRIKCYSCHKFVDFNVRVLLMPVQFLGKRESEAFI